MLCPGGKYPIGGGMIADPAPGPDGEGVYPHSYERLGAQRGFHISAVLFDPTRASTTSRDITIQTVCARGQIPQNPTPHKTCSSFRADQVRDRSLPEGPAADHRRLPAHELRQHGGNYVTESRAIGTNAWGVTGSAYIGSGTTGGGELTAIAYCVKAKGPILNEVSASSPVPAMGNASATTSSCPSGLTLTSTGFSLNGSRNAFYGGSSLNSDGTTTANAFGYFDAADSLTAYGYCQRTR